MCQDKRPHSNFSPSKIAQDVQAQPFPWNRLEVVNGSNIPQSLGTIRTFENGKQPFATEISSAAAMMMDVHAHLNGDNISGLLAGHWDSNSRHLRLVNVFFSSFSWGLMSALTLMEIQQISGSDSWDFMHCCSTFLLVHALLSIGLSR